MLVSTLTITLASWPLLLAWLAHRTPTASWLRWALFPGLGISYMLLFVLGEIRNPLLVRLDVPFGELAGLSPGKSLGNALEIPLVFLASAWARRYLNRRQRAGQGGEDAGTAHFLLACYGCAWAFYFLMPLLPE